MRSLSSAFKQELANDNRAYLEYVNFTLSDNTSLNLTNEHLWQNGFTLDDAVSSGDKFQVGTAIINKLTLIINNIYEDFDEYDFFGATAAVSIGLQVNGVIESINLGTFTVVNQPVYNGALITIELYDNMYKFDRPYNESDRQTQNPLVYPASLDTIVRDACTKCGVTLITTNFPNKSYVVDTRPDDEELTFREVLAYAAQIAGCYARCNSNGYLELKWFDQAALTSARTNNNVNGVHYLSSLYSKRFSTDDVVITGVKVSMDVERPESYTQDGKTYIRTVHSKEEYLYGSEGYVISIEDNPLIMENKVQTVATYLGGRINGFAFRTAEIAHSSTPAIEAGDVAIVTDGKGKKYAIVISQTVFSVGSAQKTSSLAEEPVRNSAARYSVETKNYVEMRKLIAAEKTERDRMEEDLARRIDESQGLYETQVQTAGGGVITYLHDKPDLEDSDIQIRISTVGVTVTADGTATNPTWYGLTVDGQLIANILAVSGIHADWINTGQLLIEKNGVEVFFADVDTGTVRVSGNSIQIVANDTVDTAIKEGTRTVLDNAQAYGLGLKVNYSAFNTATNGQCYYHGYSTTGAAADVNGWVQWNGNKVNITKGLRINPGSTMPYNATLYSVYRTNDQSWHDVTWIESANVWQANTYTNSTPSARTTWTWNEDTDVILASYSSAGSGNAITNAKLFTPPKKFSELSEVASQKAKLYTDTTLSSFATTINAEIEDIQEQLDGVVDTYYYGYTPTANNIPAVEWTTTELKEEHEGDLFLDTSTGKSYRWVNDNNVWQWKEIPDTAAAQALLAAQNAQDTADNKRRVFLVEPDPPYDAGDLWMQGANGDILACINTRSTGNFVSTDWSKLNKYTDDTATDLLAIRVTDLETETVAYYMEVSQAAVVKDLSGVYDPSTITVSAKAQQIGEALTSYSGWFKIETKTGSTWTSRYTTTTTAESSHTYTIPANTEAIRCSLYKESALTTLLDQQTVPIVSDGPVGERGTGILNVTTAPSEFTTQTGGFTPSYRILLSTVTSESGADEVLVGDTIQYSYYQYPVGYVANLFAYLGDRVSIRGADGVAGLNNATVTLYQRGTTAPTKPTGNLTYTFATGVLSGSYLGYWTQNIPSGTDPVWAIFASASAATATDTISASDWSSQVMVLENGTDGTSGIDGYNQATVFLYRRAASAPSKPSGTFTYTFASGVLNPVPTGWSRTIPSGDNPCYVTTGAAVSQSATYNITSWSDVVKLAEDGTDGTDGEDAYTVLLTNESHTFAGSENGALASSTTCGVITYKGATQVSCYVGSSSSATSISTGVTGLSCSISNNNSTSVSLTFTATTSLVAQSGTVTIPVHVDGKTFNSVFSFAIALKGEDGERGATWYPGTAINGTSTTPQTYNTGITNAIVDDHYLNTNTQNVYVCTLGGNQSTALWKYEQNIKGQNGTPGTDGSNAYLHVKYSDDGGETFTGHSGEDPGDWIGTYSDNIQADSSNVSSYTWAKIKGEDGADGRDGEDAYTLDTPFAWTNNGTTAEFEAIIYKGDEDVTNNYPNEWFEWYLRNEDGENRIAIGKTCYVTKSSLGYGSTITCIFTTYDNVNAQLLTRSGAGLQTRSGLRLTTYIQAEGDQPITELPVKTASSVLLDDQLLGIDAADGYIVSISDFASKLATSVYDARYVNVTGDTMSGDLAVVKTTDATVTCKNTSINAKIGQTYPSELTGVGGFRIMDSTGNSVGWVRTYETSSGTVYTELVARRFDASGAIIANGIYLYINAEGVTSVAVSNQSAWRSAIGAVAKTGDTMTGALTLNNSTINIKNTGFTVGTAPGSAVYGVGFRMLDNAGTVVCYYRAMATTTNRTGAQIETIRSINGTNIYNHINMLIDSDGNRIVELSEAAPWRSALGLGTNLSWSGTLSSTTGIGTAETQVYKSSSTYTFPAGTYLMGLTVPISASTETAGIKMYIGSTNTITFTVNTRETAGTSAGYVGMEGKTIIRVVTLSSAITNYVYFKAYGQSSNVTWRIHGYNTACWFAVKLA